MQAAICEHWEGLSAAGVLYPRELGPVGAKAHHFDIDDLLGPSMGPTAVRLQDCLRRNPDRTVLVSSEGLSSWLAVEGGRPLLSLLAAAQEVTPVTCLWALRSVDTLLTSIYLLQLALTPSVPSRSDFVAEVVTSLPLAMGTMCVLDDLAEGGGSYARYDRSGSHCEELLHRVGVPDALRAEVVGTLQRGRRLNVRLGEKGAAMLRHLDAVEARIGAPLSRAALAGALRRGELRFAHDPPCELFGFAERLDVHREALRISREAGLAPYAEFFEEHEVRPSPAASLDPDVLTDDDLERLRRVA